MHYLKSDDGELQCIALGHDIIEDTDTTYEALIQAGMTTRVIEAIYLLTKQPGQTLDQYKARVMSNTDAMLVKLADLRHNSDIRRLKGLTDKDTARLAKYFKFYSEIKEKLNNAKSI